jgi:beta-lactamase regulating signal transducer with metallopeptidase domain
MIWTSILNVFVQVTLIASMGLLVAGVLRSAAHRHSVLLVTLLCILSAPLLYIGAAWAGISFNVAAILPIIRDAESTAFRPTVRNPGPEDGVGKSFPEPSSKSVSPGLQGAPVTAGSPLNPVAEIDRGGTAKSGAHFGPDWLVVGFWIAGALFSLLGMVRSQLKINRILRAARPLGRDIDTEVIAEAEQKLNAVGQLRIATTGKVAGPVVVGLFAPWILIPVRYLETLSREELLQVLIHEGAHALRRDPLVALLQRLSTTLFWWHPLVYLVNRELTSAREEICDNFVLTCTEPEAYGATLLRLATISPAMAQIPLTIGIFDGHGKLANRIERLLDARRIIMTQVKFATGATVLIAFGLFSVMVACARVGADDDPAATPTKESETNAAKSGEARDVKQLRLLLSYRGESDKPFYNLILSVPPVSHEAKPFTLFHQITVEQGEKLLSHLNKSHFFENAAAGKGDLVFETKPGYVLSAEFGETSFDESLGWDLETIVRLDALRKSLDGDAAKSMDQLLARLDGQRKVWKASAVVAAASDDDYHLLHDRYRALILAAVRAGKKKDVEELTKKFNESIGGKLLFAQVTPRVGPLVQHEVMFSKFFDSARKLVVGKIHFAIGDKPIVSRNHEGQSVVLIATNPLEENKWPDDLQVTLVIDQTPSSETAAYENAIDQVVKKLPNDGMWTNGLTPNIGLAADAKPEDVVAEAIKKHAAVGEGKPYRLLHVKTVEFAPPIGSVSAALIQSDAGAKVLLFYPFPGATGWWTRFYESEFVPAKSRELTSVQKTSAYSVAIDGLIAKLARDGLWRNGKVPQIRVAADAKATDVIAEAFKKRDSTVGAVPYRVLRIQTITSDPQFKDASAALIQYEKGTIAMIFFPQVSEGWSNWWTRFYELDLPPESLESTSYGDEMFDRAVGRLNSNRRGWDLNGRRDTVKLPVTATDEELIKASLQIANPPFNEVKSFRVVSVRKLEKLVAPGTTPWSGALLDTNLGQKLLAWGYLSDEAGWWPVLLDLVPAANPAEPKSGEAE